MRMKHVHEEAAEAAMQVMSNGPLPWHEETLMAALQAYEDVKQMRHASDLVERVKMAIVLNLIDNKIVTTQTARAAIEAMGVASDDACIREAYGVLQVEYEKLKAELSRARDVLASYGYANDDGGERARTWLGKHWPKGGTAE